MKRENIEKETVRLALDMGYTEEFDGFMERKAKMLLSRVGSPQMSVMRRLTGGYDYLTISLLVFTETQGLAGELLIESKGINPFSETYDIDISWIPEPDADILQIRRRMAVLICMLKEEWMTYYHKIRTLNTKKGIYFLFLFLFLIIFIGSLVSGQRAAMLAFSGVPAVYCTVMLVRTLMEYRKTKNNG